MKLIEELIFLKELKEKLVYLFIDNNLLSKSTNILIELQSRIDLITNKLEEEIKQ